MRSTQRITNINEVYYGKEPVVDSFPADRECDEFMTEVSDAMHWYSKNSDASERKEYYLTWLEDFSPEDVKSVKKLDESRFLVCGSLARIYSNGVQDSDYINDKLMASLEKFQIEMGEEAEKRAAGPSSPKVVRIDARLISMITSITEAIEEFIEADYKNKKFDMNTWLELNRPSPVQLAAVKAKFTPLLDEIRQSFADPYLNEGYSNMTRKQRGLFCEFLQNIVGAKRARKMKKERKQRAKKEKPVEILLAKVKYCPIDPTLDIKSRKPQDVLTSSFVMTYNTKYRVVNYLLAVEGQTLDIKGTTIQNMDKKNSFAKRIRKPEEVIPVLIKANAKTAKKNLMGLTTQEIEATGRLNEDILILRCV